jgi:hypothetical protein
MVMRPGTAHFNSVPRSKLQRFSVLEFRPPLAAADGDLPGDILQFHIGAAALQVDPSPSRPYESGRCTHVQAHIAAHLGKPHVAPAAGDLDIALDTPTWSPAAPRDSTARPWARSLWRSSEMR